MASAAKRKYLSRRSGTRGDARQTLLIAAPDPSNGLSTLYLRNGTYQQDLGVATQLAERHGSHLAVHQGQLLPIFVEL